MRRAGHIHVRATKARSTARQERADALLAALDEWIAFLELLEHKGYELKRPSANDPFLRIVRTVSAEPQVRS